MSEVQIAIIGQEDTQITLAVPGVQGPVGAGVAAGGTTNQVLFKASATNYDVAWGGISSAMITDLAIVDADINANAEIAVSKLADGAARQLLQTDAAGTGVEWASNIDIPGTLDVTSAATFDSTVAVTGALTKSGNNVVTVGDTGTVTSTMLLDGTILNADINASAAIVDTKLATIATAGKVSNSATTATDANTASAIVARNASGNFTAGTITAALTGAASSNVLKAGDTMTGVLAVTAGTAALPAITPSGDPNTGIYSPGADELAISTNGTSRLSIDASGNLAVDTNILYVDATNNRVGVGTTGPTEEFNIIGDIALGVDAHVNQGTYTIRGGNKTTGTDAFNAVTLQIKGGDAIVGSGAGSTGAGSLILSAGNATKYAASNGLAGNVTIKGGTVTTGGFGGSVNPGRVTIETAGVERARIDSSGNVGIGTTGPDALLTVNGIGAFGAGAVTTPSIAATGDLNTGFWFPAADTIAASTGGSERLRVDTSGRLLVGTSTARTVQPDANTTAGYSAHIFETVNSGLGFITVCQNAASTLGAGILLAKTRGTSTGDSTIVANNDTLGTIGFAGADGTDIRTGAAAIYAQVDGTPGANDMPGRLVFSTTADGSDSATERMRITNNGALLVGTTSTPTGAGSGAVVAQDRIIIGATAAGLNQVYVGQIGTITGTTGTVTFRFTSTSNACYVKLSFSLRSSSNVTTNSPIGDYAFQLFKNTTPVCTLNGATTLFEYGLTYATHVSFADLGSGVCEVTVTNPTASSLLGAYKVEILDRAGTWSLTSVTAT